MVDIFILTPLDAAPTKNKRLFKLMRRPKIEYLALQLLLLLPQMTMMHRHHFHIIVSFFGAVVAGVVPESAAPLKCPNILFSEHGDSLKKVPRIFMELN
jgi:hypothetical protein